MGQKELAIGKIIFDIGKDLCRGEKRSNDLGLLLLHTSVLFNIEPDKFDKMANHINSGIYENELRGFWNEIYTKSGGVIGSGGFNFIETEKANEIAGFNMEKCLEGLDPDGFNKLQSLIPFMQEIAPIPPTTEAFFKLQTLIWAIFISTFKDGAIDKLTAIMSLPEFTPNKK